MKVQKIQNKNLFSSTQYLLFILTLAKSIATNFSWTRQISKYTIQKWCTPIMKIIHINNTFNSLSEKRKEKKKHIEQKP